MFLLEFQTRTRSTWQSRLVTVLLFSLAFNNCHAVGEGDSDGKKQPDSLLQREPEVTTGSSNMKVKAKSLMAADEENASKPDKAKSLWITDDGNLKSTTEESLIIPPPGRVVHQKADIPKPSKEKPSSKPSRAISLLKTTPIESENNSKNKKSGGAVKSLLEEENEGSDTKKRMPVKSLMERERDDEQKAPEEYLLVKKDLDKSKSVKPPRANSLMVEQVALDGKKTKPPVRSLTQKGGDSKRKVAESLLNPKGTAGGLEKKKASILPRPAGGDSSKGGAATSLLVEGTSSATLGEAKPLGPVLLITGSNRGLGLEVLEQLLNMEGNIKVILATYRSTSDRLLEIASQYGGTERNGKIVKIVQMELDDEEGIVNGLNIVKRELAELCAKNLIEAPMINTIIHNAGIMDTAVKVKTNPNASRNPGVHPLVVDYDSYLRHLRINTVAPAFITAKLKHLLDASELPPRIVFISSTISSMNEFAKPFRSHQNVVYQMSKSALNTYMKNLAEVKSEQSIGEKIEKQYVAYPLLERFYENPGADTSKLELSEWICVSICPGWVETDMGNLADTTKSQPVKKEVAAARLIAAIESLEAEDNGKFYSLFFPGKKGKLMTF